MQLKSLLSILKTHFLRHFVLPLMIFLFFMLLALLVMNMRIKRNEDIAYIETIKAPLINSMITYQPQEAQMLLSSISIFRGWKESYLVSKDNLILTTHPHENSNSLGRSITSECKTYIELYQRGQNIGKICYLRNAWAFLDYTIIVVLAGAIFAAGLIIYFYKNLILKLNYIFSRLSRVVELLENSTYETLTPEFLEEDKIASALHEKILLLQKVKEKEIESLESVTRMQVAEQVSHDIRSPLEALKNVVSNNRNISKSELSILNNSIKRINDIANDLLKHKDKYDIVQIENIDELLVLMVSEKKIQHEKNSDVKIFFTNLLNEKVTINFQESELLRILSNLINNSFESISGTGEINLSLKKLSNKEISISIKDTGKGMSQNMLNNIGQRGLSEGKNGSGLGLYHAKKLVENYGGVFKVESALNKGTIVNLELPIELQNEYALYEYVYIDNDELCRLVWKSSAQKRGIKILILASIKDFNRYIKAIDKNKTQIYIDSDLGSDSIKGEDFAYELYKDGFKSLFIATGYSEERFKHLTWLNYSSKKCPF